MTETQSSNVTKHSHLSTSPDTLRQRDLKAANYRLNEQLKRTAFDLAQCRENSDRHKLQRNEARQWARALLARAENLDWVVERVGASWREGEAELEKKLAMAQERIAELEQPEPDADEVFFEATKRLSAAIRGG